jgi:glycosyltransferase involved in cell wall biosynthesis
MHIAIIRREPQISFSMDLYADSLVAGLKTVRPYWNIVEFASGKNLDWSKNNKIFNGLRKYYQRYYQYPRIINQQKFDIIHIIDHSDGHFAYWLKNKNNLLVITCHDLINFHHPENISQQAKLPILSTKIWQYAIKGLREANKIITVSTNTARDVTRILKVESEKTIVIPNAVESIFQPISQDTIEVFRRQYGLSPQTFCLLHVGSNHPRKNVFSILKTVASLKERSLDIHFLKVGGDFTDVEKRYIKERDLTNYVSYLGKPEKATLVKIYNVADVLISPSLHEGFGITILEAMACGIPVVTSNSTSLPEVAGNAAILVDPLDVDAITEAVMLVKNKANLRQSLIDAGLARAKVFTWEKTAEAVANLYESLVNQKVN